MKKAKYIIIGFPPAVYNYIGSNNLDREECIAVCSLRYIADHSKHLIDTGAKDIQCIYTSDAVCMEDYEQIKKVIEVLKNHNVVKGK